MRIVGGAWRGRRLLAPPGTATRPTADRVRQAIFDMLVHAPWAETLEGMAVLDAFAGTGAMGLEAISRGAATATFLEQDGAALRTLRANIAACGAAAHCRVLAADCLHPPPGSPCGLVFLDPPYGAELVARAIPALRAHGWIGPGALVVAEIGRAETLPVPTPDIAAVLAERTHGAARVLVLRAVAGAA